MSALLPRFYPIVDSASWIERLLPTGIELVQLRRKKPADEPQAPWQARLAEEIQFAQRMCERANCILVINDEWRLAIELGCQWVHLGQEDLACADMNAIRAAGLRYGISSHSHQELERALAARPDYVALGPVFPTQLKKMPWSPQGLGRVSEWKHRIGALPLVAIGGLTPDRACAVLQAGADSAAVVTDLVQHGYPERRAREWISATTLESTP